MLNDARNELYQNRTVPPCLSCTGIKSQNHAPLNTVSGQIKSNRRAIKKSKGVFRTKYITSKLAQRNNILPLQK